MWRLALNLNRFLFPSWRNPMSKNPDNVFQNTLNTSLFVSVTPPPPPRCQCCGIPGLWRTLMSNIDNGGEGGCSLLLWKTLSGKGLLASAAFYTKSIDVIYRNRVLSQKLASRESWEQVAAEASFLLEQLLQENTTFCGDKSVGHAA